jgi:hypothetical protein
MGWCCDDDMKLRRIDLDLTTALPKNKAWRSQCCRWTLAPNRNLNQHRSIWATFLARDNIASVRFWCSVVPQGTPLGSGNGNKDSRDIPALSASGGVVGRSTTYQDGLCLLVLRYVGCLRNLPGMIEEAHCQHSHVAQPSGFIT